MLNESTRTGMNRTGIQSSRDNAETMVEGIHLASVNPAMQNGDINRLRQAYYEEAEPIGTVPPPSNLTGLKNTGGLLLKGKRAEVLINKLGERLAFERTGVRLYEAFLSKCQLSGDVPFIDRMRHYYREEESHFHLLTRAIQKLGADPTSVTPGADVSGVASQGLLKVVADPRTTIAQSLEAILIAELVDYDGWQSLIELAREAGQEEMVRDFERAGREEEEHLRGVRRYVKQMNAEDASLL